MKVQSFFCFVVGLALVLPSSTVFADSNYGKDVLAQLEQIKTRLKTSAGASVACDVPQLEECSFQKMCSKFDGKARDFYLYENDEGRKIPNFQMIAYTSSTEACLGKAYPQPLVTDPFVYTKQLTDPDVAGGGPQLNKNYLRYEAEGKRSEKIFNDAQERIVKLLGSRRTSENAEGTDEMITRIKAVKFNIPKSNYEISTLAADGCEIPNAFYSAGTHTVTICPQMMNLPDAAIFSIISHELGHSIDPCQSAKPYVQNGDKIAVENPFYSLYTPANQDSYFIFKAISAAKNPLKEVITCLQTKESLGVVIPSLKVAQDYRRESLLRQMGGTSAQMNPAMAQTFEEQDRSIRMQYETYKTCAELTGHGHMQEGFSDWIATQTLKQKLSEIQDTGKAQRYAFESQALYLGLRCQNLNETAVAYLRPLVKNKCPDLLASMDSADRSNDESKSHPATANRVNRIFFAVQEMQTALGCHKDENLKECQ
jgi:hypothetical protein